jgi:hypothetical protein
MSQNVTSRSRSYITPISRLRHGEDIANFATWVREQRERIRENKQKRMQKQIDFDPFYGLRLRQKDKCAYCEEPHPVEFFALCVWVRHSIAYRRWTRRWQTNGRSP